MCKEPVGSLIEHCHLLGCSVKVHFTLAHECLQTNVMWTKNIANASIRMLKPWMRESRDAVMRDYVWILVRWGKLQRHFSTHFLIWSWSWFLTVAVAYFVFFTLIRFC